MLIFHSYLSLPKGMFFNHSDFNAAWAKELCCVCGLRSAEAPNVADVSVPRCETPVQNWELHTKTLPLTLGHKAGCIMSHEVSQQSQIMRLAL